MCSLGSRHLSEKAYLYEFHSSKLKTFNEMEPEVRIQYFPKALSMILYISYGFDVHLL
jgi:hypothetical protein